MANADVAARVAELVADTLSLDQDTLNQDTMLLGHIPEFDSMSIVSVVTAIEETFSVEIPDDELTAEVFESVGTLADFVGQLTEKV